jgi:UPF0755 protein
MSQYRKRSDGGRTRTAAARSPAERLEPSRAPGRPRGLNDREPSRFIAGLVRVVSSILTVSLVSMLLVGTIAFAVFTQYESPGTLEAPRTVVIPKGEGRIAIAERLEKEGVISNRWTFVGGYLLQSWIGSKKNAELKAGEYEIKEHASMREVIETLAEGKSILYKTTLPEGLTSEQIVERLKAEPNLSGEIASVPPEGTLLPDTYYYSKGASRQEIIDRMRAEMQKALAALWETRDGDLPLRSVEELVTFASIIEKETGRMDERDRVAAVFYNRLRKGMRLQSDPTIIYGIVGGQGTLGRAITKADIDTKTPYNTYQIAGLPPGPICNPGKSALMAALHPAKTADLYFVADGNGGHTFSETLKEHNSAVQKWRAVEKQGKSKVGADDDTIVQDSNSVPIPEGPDEGPRAAPSKPVKSATAAAPANATGDDATADGGTEIPLPVRKPKKQ